MQSPTPILDLVFPRRCPICDKPVKPYGELICRECAKVPQPVGEYTCCKCGKPVDPEEEYCSDCRVKKHIYYRGAAAFRYRSVSGSLYRFKYEGRREYADYYGREMAQVLEHFLEELTNLSGEAVHLVERSGSEVVYLYKFEPYSNPINISSSVGRHNPMYCTGVGKSILAYLPEEEVKAIWESSDVQQFTEKTLTTLPALLADLQAIRERGYAIDDEEHDLGVRCIAAPIFNWDDQPIAAISISAPSNRMTEEVRQKLAPKLMNAAEEISGLLGKKPE